MRIIGLYIFAPLFCSCQNQATPPSEEVGHKNEQHPQQESSSSQQNPSHVFSITPEDFKKWDLDGVWESPSKYVRGTYVFVQNGKNLFMETPTKGLEKPSISFVGGLDTKQDRLILKQKLSNSMASVPILKLQKSHSQQLEGVIELPIQSKQPIAVVFTKKNIP